MADDPKLTNGTEVRVDAPRRHWLAQNSRTVIFIIIVVALVGAYQAFTIPVAVFLHGFPPHRDRSRQRRDAD